jgi:hypothetical protein
MRDPEGKMYCVKCESFFVSAADSVKYSSKNPEQAAVEEPATEEPAQKQQKTQSRFDWCGLGVLL